MDRDYFYTESLTVGYQGVPLIKDIAIGLKKGEILTLIGPNGAGKTTILKSLIRQLKPIKGVAVLDGVKTETMNGRTFARKLSVVLTERIHPEMMSCRDVVATGRYPYTGKFGILSKEDEAIVDASIRLVHIEALSERDFTKISDGQRQRVMLFLIGICRFPAGCQQTHQYTYHKQYAFLFHLFVLSYLLFVFAYAPKCRRTCNNNGCCNTDARCTHAMP
jgi:iron complex transport system ATP-binding protein